jgi:prepilin-type N-terminal cleavage/methylation domain-containing protein
MKKAFTMMELVFVIVVVGILSAMIAPNFQRNTLREAADQLISHIRYTQHLAMMDDKYDENNAIWYKERWQLRFSKNVDTEQVWAYTIFSDTSNHDGNPNINDIIARNPINQNQYLSGGFSGVISLTDPRRDKAMAVGEKYGILDIQFLSGCATANRIAFDYLGRPIQGDLNTSISVYQIARLMTRQCQIALCLNNPCDDRNITIAVEPETGYAHIL